MKKILCFLLAVVLMSCVTTNVREVNYSESSFISETPHLKVKLKEVNKTKYLGKENYHGAELHSFQTGYDYFFIQLYQFTGRDAYVLDYWHYSDSVMARDIFEYETLDSVLINDQKWLRIFKGDKKDSDLLYIGYFKKKGDYYVLVFRPIKLGNQAHLFNTYLRTRNFTTELRRIMEDYFTVLNQLFEILE